MLNERIKELRQSYQLNQVEMAKILGVSKQCVSNWENDNVLPSIEMLVRLAKYFNVSTDYLLGLEDCDKISVKGLSDRQVAHIKLLIQDMMQIN